MRVESIEAFDKEGRKVILRSACEDDAEDLIKYLKETAKETPYLLREEDEINLTVEDEKGLIKMFLELDNALMLLAYVDGKHVGNCSFSPVGPFKRIAHRCDMAIALYQEHCGFGIGGIMLETALRFAKEAGYEQAELEVVSNNTKAIKLYEKCGFKKYGVKPDSMKYCDGSNASMDWMMVKL